MNCWRIVNRTSIIKLYIPHIPNDSFSYFDRIEFTVLRLRFYENFQTHMLKCVCVCVCLGKECKSWTRIRTKVHDFITQKWFFIWITLFSVQRQRNQNNTNTVRCSFFYWYSSLPHARLLHFRVCVCVPHSSCFFFLHARHGANCSIVINLIWWGIHCCVAASIISSSLRAHHVRYA